MFIELVNSLPKGQKLDSAWPIDQKVNADISLESLRINGFDASIEVLPVIEFVNGKEIQTLRYCILYIK